MPKTYLSSGRSRKKAITRKRKKPAKKVDLEKLEAQSQVDSLTRQLQEAKDRISMMENDTAYAYAAKRLVKELKQEQRDAAKISGITELEYAVNLFNVMRLEWVPRSAISINY